MRYIARLTDATDETAIQHNLRIAHAVNLNLHRGGTPIVLAYSRSYFPPFASKETLITLLDNSTELRGLLQSPTATGVSKVYLITPEADIGLKDQDWASIGHTNHLRIYVMITGWKWAARRLYNQKAHNDGEPLFSSNVRQDFYIKNVYDSDGDVHWDGYQS